MKKIEWNDILNCLNIMKPIVSLDMQLQDGRIIGNYIADASVNVEDEVTNKIDREILRQAISKTLILLTTLERQALILYFGLDGMKPMSTGEIAKLKGCTAQNIQQSIKNGIKKLRENQTLKEYYEILN